MDQATYIIVNPNCHQGHGWKRWLSIKTDVLKHLPGAREVVTKNMDYLNAQLDSLFHCREETIIVSAGGDGSIHYLANKLLRSGDADKSKITLGAIGLGSSNDFHKPFRSFIKNIPVRIDTAGPFLCHDVGRALYIDENKNQQEKFFVVNASFGATAEGNWNFNNPGRILKWLKKNNTNVAIQYAAITTILSHKNKFCSIRFDNEERKVLMSNINLLKIPYVSGSLHYQQSIFRDDGRLGLNICHNMSKWELLQTLFDLEKGKFAQNGHKISLLTDRFHLASKTPIVFECDGETIKTFEVQVSVIPKAIKLLNN